MGKLDFYPRPPRGGRHKHSCVRDHLNFISIHALREEGDAAQLFQIFDVREFLSTPSARRATPLRTFRLLAVIYFYPRPPRGGRRLRPGWFRPIRYFYPRPPRGGRPVVRLSIPCDVLFLSTPSARRATVDIKTHADRDDISIHALREEGDICYQVGSLIYVISIHALREEGDVCLIGTVLHRLISIHALREEGDCGYGLPSCPCADFYPRPPRGGRPCYQGIPGSAASISIHALREEGDPQLCNLICDVGQFLSTPSSRRATATVVPYFAAIRISIHALREEGDELRHRAAGSVLHFYPRPPRGGRRVIDGNNAVSYEISIHALREEGDPSARPSAVMERISIHALREEGDRWRNTPMCQPPAFLSTPSARRATLPPCSHSC